ncbi:hypothetical protein WCLP8_410004 [uncultured Gammaproteobacteria bacterium]
MNPIERVWLHLRECFLSHRLLNDYDAIVQACCEAWNRLADGGGGPAMLTGNIDAELVGFIVSAIPSPAGRPGPERHPIVRLYAWR